jgi:hypothetical protein
MKKLTLSLMLGLGLVTQIHDLTAEDSKPLDYKYLVLSETVIEDMDAFEALQKGWSSWRNDNNIKMADQTVWTDSQGYGFTASTYKSFSEIEKNNDIGQGAVIKYLSESADKSIEGHWRKMSTSYKNSVWKIRNDISGKSLNADVGRWMDFRINRFIHVKKEGMQDFVEYWKYMKDNDKEIENSYDYRIYENIYGYDGPCFMLTVGSSDVFNYYAEWKIREDKREKTEKFEKMRTNSQNSIRKSVVHHLTLKRELSYKK